MDRTAEERLFDGILRLASDEVNQGNLSECQVLGVLDLVCDSIRSCREYNGEIPQ